MRKKIAAANWKMNTTPSEGLSLFHELQRMFHVGVQADETIICAPFVHLSSLLNDTSSPFCIGAQNCYTEDFGAFTGEVSAPMLKSMGVEYVILGHSERRTLFHETNEIVKAKVDVALSNGLKVIFCCGESLELREKGMHQLNTQNQIQDSLSHLTASQWKNVVIAYEPIWAIGTGKTATPQQAQEMHAFIRSVIAKIATKEVADNCSILYGGSIKASNANELFACDDIDGGLVGGASLNANEFYQIANSF